MKKLVLKGLEKAAEALKDLEDDYMAFVVCDKKTKEVCVDGYCVAFPCFSIGDLIEEDDEIYDIKVYQTMTAEELGDYIEFLISLKPFIK